MNIINLPLMVDLQIRVKINFIYKFDIFDDKFYNYEYNLNTHLTETFFTMVDQRQSPSIYLYTETVEIQI